MAIKYHVRELTLNDTQEWTKMWDKYLRFYNTTVTDEVTQHTLNKLLSDDKSVGCFVACDESNNPIGFSTYITHFSTWRLNPVCYLHDLFVEEEHRGRGIAKLLLKHLENLASSEGWARIYWLTKPDNEAARKLYDKIAQSELWVRYSLNLL